MSRSKGQYLDKDTFQTVISSAPLVSIDLIVVNENNQVLLGERLNRPAQGFWFVPGGRIYKNERLEEAFMRITRDELGQEVQISQANLIGPFTHLYEDCVFTSDVSTHYVALGYRLQINSNTLAPPTDQQHCRYQWFDINTLDQQDNVHKHTKWYFNPAFSSCTV